VQVIGAVPVPGRRYRIPALWSAIVTVRHDQTIRIISVRRCRDHEIGLYLNRALGDG
jgi:uncharacterized DUF497 family protein